MCSHLPLDDRLNRVFYSDHTLCRLVYDKALGHCVMRPQPQRIDVDHAIVLIAHGDLLWSPPEEFQQLSAITPCDAVQHEHDLLCAFLLSPAARRIPGEEMKLRLLGRLTEDVAWLARHKSPRDGSSQAHGP